MKVDTAIVLAGGPGTRLKPLTNDLPKGLVDVNGKPLLQWIIEWLRDNEVYRIILGVAYLKEKIMSFFGNGEQLGVNIRYSVHTVEGGTGEGFRLAISRYNDRDIFLAMNGDQITDLDLEDVVDFHLKNHSLATMVVNNPRCPYGHVTIDDEHNLMEFLEKPYCRNALCNAGIYVFSRDILSYLPEKGDIEKTVLPMLGKSRRLRVYPFDGFFVTINTIKDIVESEIELKRRQKS